MIDVAYYGAYPMGLYQPMQNQYQPMMNQPMQMSQPQNQGAQITNMQQTGGNSNFFCRPVASKEEALGVPVDFMGSPMFFPDLAHNVVYMKRFNTNTGSADVFEFHGTQQEAPKDMAPAFAPLDEFMSMKDTIAQLKEEIERLKKPAGRTVKKNEPNDE